MFEICLFDLDDTLVRTTDLKQVREACKQNSASENIQAVKNGLALGTERRIYSLDLLQSIRVKFPALKMGVFTRSPKSYVNTVLAWAYPGFKWDIVVAYEDVGRTKPYGDGIDLAMEKLSSEKDLTKIILVGDNDSDVRSAYHCGCLAALDKSEWSGRLPEHWRALEKVPDALIQSPQDLLKVLDAPDTFLPELERLFAGGEEASRVRRFDKINHFFPKDLGGGFVPIYVCGRSFAGYESLHWRRQWHALTHSIGSNKEATEFPDEWIKAIRSFIRSENPYANFTSRNIVITTVPHRPGRLARLEALLQQLSASLQASPIGKLNVSVAPGLMRYKTGVRSQHLEFLNRSERFANVRDHLELQGEVTRGVAYVVLDDVVTTGSSLLYAHQLLRNSGASSVTCLALAKNVGDVLP